MTENNPNIQDDKEKPIDSKPLEELTLKEVIEETATEDEAPQSRMFSLRKILGGDILSAAIIRRQVWLILLIVFFMIIYVSHFQVVHFDNLLPHVREQ